MSAYEIPGFSFTLVAAEALTQFSIVTVDTSGLAAYVAAETDPAFGVVQNTVAIGGAATVVCSGIVMVVAGTGGLTAGDLVTSDTDGTGVLAASTESVIGVCLTSAAATEYATVLLSSPAVAA